MNVVVKISEDDAIAIPPKLMAALNLREGDKVKVMMEGQILRVTPLEQFLALEGVFQDDDAFAQAMKLVEQGWQSWTPSV
ncbi:MAG: AbrB/MazE/SpoVT family DNA-binding domain-containing protein [Chloroflexi bacterium]|nr:AbrB/MazE/SpoVT family DNA-binding domain-containing protein [Chloroflexota bacterium]